MLRNSQSKKLRRNDTRSQMQLARCKGRLSFVKGTFTARNLAANDIKKIYLPMGFENFKIEGRGLGSALVLEFLLYYMVKPEYQICVREEVYLDNMLDLF